MRANPTSAEALLWSKIRKRRLGGHRFLRQRIIFTYIVDFYCAECGLIVEIDGQIHHQQIQYDEERTRYLEALGKKVIRFSNQQILENTNDVLQSILGKCKALK